MRDSISAPPGDFGSAHALSWSDQARLLLITIEGETMSLRAIGELVDGGPKDLPRFTPAGEPLAGPTMIHR